MQVMVAVLHLGKISTDVAQKLLLLQKDTRHTIQFVFPTDVPGESNRNRLVRDFLKTKNDYLLMIDEDNPPLKNPLDLIDLGLDIVGLPTPTIKNGEPIWVVAKQFPGGLRCYEAFNVQKGLQEVDAVGSGCLLVSRKVLAAISAPFMREWDKDGVAVLGQDLAFCKRARAQGFKVFAHWDYPCSHHKVTNIFDLYGIFGR